MERKPRLRHRRLPCPYCGDPFTPRDDRDCCASCHRIAVLAEMKPRAWDAAFDERLAVLFTDHRGQWIRPTRLLKAGSEDVKWGVRLLRRRGFVIEGDSAKGYMFVTWSRQRQAGEDAPAKTCRP